MYADILNGLIFDAVYGSWILSLLLFTFDITAHVLFNNWYVQQDSTDFFLPF